MDGPLGLRAGTQWRKQGANNDYFTKGYNNITAYLWLHLYALGQIIEHARKMDTVIYCIAGNSVDVLVMLVAASCVLATVIVTRVSISESVSAFIIEIWV